uniref:Uncharacterized protein n=1 Tax=Pararge aegeria TaxID=116150 RepID=S4PBT1_9NEOP
MRHRRVPLGPITTYYKHLNITFLNFNIFLWSAKDCSLLVHMCFTNVVKPIPSFYEKPEKYESDTPYLGRKGRNSYFAK